MGHGPQDDKRKITKNIKEAPIKFYLSTISRNKSRILVGFSELKEWF
jgi:hypothetical protein